MMTIVLAICLSGCSHTPQATVPVTPPMPAEQKALAHTATLDARWEDVLAQYPRATRPVADRVRYVSPNEMPQAMVECLTAAGFDAAVTSDVEGLGFTANSAAGQEEALAIGWYACEAQFPIDPEFTQPLNQAEIDFMYAYYVKSLLPCLEGMGYEMKEPPSRQTYAETFGTADGWFPYTEVYSSGQEAVLMASEACPQNPPGLRE